MFHVAWKSVLGNKLRLMLTALAVVLGVTFVSGVLVLTDTMQSAFDGLLGEISENTAAYVNPIEEVATELPGGQGIFGPTMPDDLIEQVRAVDGVAEAEGFVQSFAQYLDADGNPIGGNGPPTMGLSYVASPSSPIRIAEGGGRAPMGPGEVVVDKGTAEAQGFAIGDTVQILIGDGVREFEVVGISTFGESNNLLGATTASFDFATAQQLFDKVGRIDQIAIRSEAGVSDDELVAAVQAAIGNAYEVVSAADQVESDSAEITQGLGFFSTALLSFAGVALFVGAFIIVNTFSIIVAQRTREFALLRAIGASARQVRMAVVLEAAVVGVLASITGFAFGLGLAVGMLALLDAIGIDLPSAGTVVAPRTIIACFLVGTVVTVLSSLLPARRAARVSPVAALSGTGGADDDHIGRRRSVGGSAVTIVGVALLLTGLLADVGNRVSLVGFGVGLTFLGVAFLAPYVATPVIHAMASLPRRRGLPGRLAVANALRNPKRTAATASALMVGVALVSFVSIFGASITSSVNSLFEEQSAADFAISVGGGGGPATLPVPSGYAEQAGDLPEVGLITPTRLSNLALAGQDATSFVTGAKHDVVGELIVLDVQSGSLEDMVGPAILVDAARAQAESWAVGDVIAFDFPAAANVAVTIVGTFGNTEFLGTPFLVDLGFYEEVIGDNFDLFVMADAAAGVSIEDAKTALEALATERFPNVVVQTQSEIIQEAQDSIGVLLNVLIALLGLALFIAVIGIVNTLALSVFERTREIGLLRAVGMDRGQTRTMIRWEAIMVAVFGAVLGVAVGAFFGWAMVKALSEQGISDLRFPAGRLVLYVVAAAIAGVIAAVFPARRAARLDVLDAVTVE